MPADSRLPQSPSTLARAVWLTSFLFTVSGICLRLIGHADVISVGTNLLTEAFVMIAAMFWALHLVLTRSAAWIRSPLNVLIGVFWVLLAVSAIRAPHLQKSLPAFFDWASYLLLFLLVLQFSLRQGSAVVFIRVLVACAAVLSLYGLFQYYHRLDEIARQLETDTDATLQRMNQSADALPDIIARVKDKRIYSTFVNPNSFAGFLLMTVPLTLGLLIDTFRSRKHALAAAGALFLALSLQVYALWLTFSKSSLAIIALMLVIFAVMAAAMFLGRRRAALIALAAAGLVALGAAGLWAAGPAQPAGGSFLSSKIAGARKSLGFRLEYWAAAADMIRDNALLGVGLNNFGDRYAQYKTPTGGEVQKAHNDYLQVAAEVGVPAAFVLWTVWAWIAGASVPRRRLPEPKEDGAAERFAVAAGIAAFAVAALLLRSLDTSDRPQLFALTQVVFAGLWLFLFRHSGRREEPGKDVAAGDGGPGDLSCTRIGIAVGLFGFLLHGAGDFDLYVPGCAQTAWLLAALALALREARPAERLVRVKPAVVAATALGVAALTFAVLLPKAGLLGRCFTAETDIALARQKQAETPPSPGSFREALGLLEKAAEANPLDDEARYLLAQAWESAWYGSGNQDDTAFHAAMRGFRAAARLNPCHSAALYRIAMLYRQAARFDRYVLLQSFPGEPAGSAVERAVRELKGDPAFGPEAIGGADKFYLPYVWAAAEVITSYPLQSRYHAALGEALHLAGLDELSARAYARALEIDRVVPADHRRLKLTDDERRQAEERTARF